MKTGKEMYVTAKEFREEIYRIENVEVDTGVSRMLQYNQELEGRVKDRYFPRYPFTESYLTELTSIYSKYKFCLYDYDELGEMIDDNIKKKYHTSTLGVEHKPLKDDVKEIYYPDFEIPYGIAEYTFRDYVTRRLKTLVHNTLTKTEYFALSQYNVIVDEHRTSVYPVFPGTKLVLIKNSNTIYKDVVFPAMDLYLSYESVEDKYMEIVPRLFNTATNYRLGTIVSLRYNPKFYRKQRKRVTKYVEAFMQGRFNCITSYPFGLNMMTSLDFRTYGK